MNYANQGTNFPDEEYLRDLVARLREKSEHYQNPLDQLTTVSGASLNWIADFLTDRNIQWTKEELTLESLYLTGTGPEWNAIIIDRAERSPAKLRQLIQNDPSIAEVFANEPWSEREILVRADGEKLKVLDGMHRVVAAIRDGRATVKAYVARQEGVPRPQCEPHVVYDFLRAYERGSNRDREAVVNALRFLRKAYANVDGLLRERFSPKWLLDKELQGIVRDALAD